jgi:hypothetical protein
MIRILNPKPMYFRINNLKKKVSGFHYVKHNFFQSPWPPFQRGNWEF